ncbi:Transposon Tf2-6 polyprotein-like 3 [Homarus americanus]|uniref:Transposon Tf2-6 polyprotein-like 3 n=1 Tax=Homarus americanus TaxID=6706 RepID=A0A8J5MSW4_HOMAM|nr:Transposon Tf2-6 polyprotein-like 3 [Homarus americanus]
MDSDVRKYVSTCPQCQIGDTKMKKTAIELHPVSIASKIWHQMGVELCALPPSQEGYCAICVVADYFSKWVEAKPIRSKNSEVATFLYRLMCRFGCTRIQINDQGREFCNAVAEKLHSLTGKKQRITSSHHPQANGLVEKTSKTIQGSLLKVLKEEQDQWPRMSQRILHAFRTARHNSTGISPFEMIYARQPILPVHFIEEIDRENEDEFDEIQAFNLELEDCWLEENYVKEHLQIK